MGEIDSLAFHEMKQDYLFGSIWKVDPWLTEKRVDQKKMTVDQNFFCIKNSKFCMD